MYARNFTAPDVVSFWAYIEFLKEERAMVRAIVGANWGDEGKGKITYMLARQADIIVFHLDHADVIA